MMPTLPLRLLLPTASILVEVRLTEVSFLHLMVNMGAMMGRQAEKISIAGSTTVQLHLLVVSVAG